MKGQDILVLLDRVVSPSVNALTYAQLAHRLSLNPSQIHGAMNRLIAARLLTQERSPKRKAVCEFVLHGLPYLFPATIGARALGVPTAWATKPMNKEINGAGVVVRPSAWGKVQGNAVTPIHKAVPVVALEYKEVHEIFALVDCLRVGRSREKQIASRLISELILGRKRDD